MSSLLDRILEVLLTGHRYYDQRPWGSMTVIKTNEFVIKLVTVRERCRTSLQFHEHKHEVCVLLSGSGRLELGDPREHDGNHVQNLRPGLAHKPINIPPGTIHRMVGPTYHLEITSTEEDGRLEDTVRLEDDYGRT